MWPQNTLPCTKVSLNKPTQGKKELTEQFCLLYHSFNVVRSLCESFVQQCFCLFLRDWVLQADCGQQGEGLCICPQGFIDVVCHHHGFTNAVGCQVTLDETWWCQMETLESAPQALTLPRLFALSSTRVLNSWHSNKQIQIAIEKVNLCMSTDSFYRCLLMVRHWKNPQS